MMLNSLSSFRRRRFLLASAGLAAAPALARSRSLGRDAEIEDLLISSFEPVAKTYEVPGMALGLLVNGRLHFRSLGKTARENGSAVTPETLFEVGSISKCFTSLLAAKAYTDGILRLDQPIGDVLSPLRGTGIGKATALHLATYTAGGLPLQFPDGLTTSGQALAWSASFTPSAPLGAVRQYSNPSVALLGHLTAQAMGGSFADLVQRALFEPLGLRSTFIDVPATQMSRYSWGHDQQLKRVRVNPGVFDAEAYGVKSSARDMLWFLRAVLDSSTAPAALRKAIDITAVPRYQAGAVQQGMGWELYPWPTPLETLQRGNGPSTVLDPLPAEVILTNGRPEVPLLLNKTGSTGGFGAYVALLPHQSIALVMLANRNFPAVERVAATRKVLVSLAG